MINKIGIATNVQQTRLAFKSEPTVSKLATNPNQKIEAQALDLTATYNKAYTEILNIKPTPLLLSPNIDAKEAVGEKIYTSDGKLHSIIRDSDKARILFQFNLDEENTLDSIQISDKRSGKIIKEQIGYDSVLEYHPITSKLVKDTHYEDGELCCVTKLGFKNGKEEEIYFDAKENCYTVYEKNPRTNEYTISRFDKNKQLHNVIVEKDMGSKSETLDIDFYNGSIISTTKSTKSTFPNTMGRESMNLENMNPHSKCPFTEKDISDLRAFAGDKTYYSNGFLETNSLDMTKFGIEGTAICHFTPDGKLVKIVTDKKSIDLNSSMKEIIEEELPDGSIKKTTHYKDGSCYVDLTNIDSHKFVAYDEKGNIYMYKDNEQSLSFNKNGMLDYAYSENEN